MNFCLAKKFMTFLFHLFKYKQNTIFLTSVQFSSVQSLSHVRLCDPMNPSSQASLFITNSRSSLRPTSIESVMLSSHLILCRPLLLLPPIPPSIRVFSNESSLRMRWPKYWSFSFSIKTSMQFHLFWHLVLLLKVQKAYYFNDLKIG